MTKSRTTKKTESNKEQLPTAAGIKQIFLHTECKVNNEWSARIPCREYAANELKTSILSISFDYTNPAGEFTAFGCTISLLELMNLVLSSKYVTTFKHTPERPAANEIQKELIENFIGEFIEAGE